VAPNGKIYSDENSLRDLHQLRRSINRAFYSPGQILRLARTAVQNDGLALLPGLLPRLPPSPAAPPCTGSAERRKSVGLRRRLSHNLCSRMRET